MSDPDYPESYYHKAIMSLQSWDWELSEKAFLKSIELNPNHSFAHAHYSHLLMYQNRYAEAESHTRIAMKLDPLNPHIIGLCAIVYHSSGETEKAVSLIRKNPEAFSRKNIEESIYYSNKEFMNSVKLLLQISRADSVISNLTLDEYKINGYQSALLILAEDLERHHQVPAILLAQLYNRAGKQEEAIRVLEEGFENHDPNMQYVFAIPNEFENLEKDPRYIRIAEKMNLPL